MKIFWFFFFFSRIFITYIRNPWHEGVYIPYGKSRLWGFEKIYVGRLFSGYLKLGVLGAWMTFKKAEMSKTLKNGLGMIETNPLNHNWLDFAILLGLTLHQFQKKLLLRTVYYICQPFLNSDASVTSFFADTYTSLESLHFVKIKPKPVS